MPYTLVHPGFTFPFKKSKTHLFSTTGLVFGSIAPDFDIIFRLSNQRIHIFQFTIIEILFLILPIAALSAVYYHLVIKDILIEFAPPSLRSDLFKYKNFSILSMSFTNWLKFAGSILFAILLHLFLDLISHYDAYYFKLNGIVFFQSLLAGEIVYYAAMYLPALFFSVLGFLLTLKALKETSIKIPSIISFIENTKTKKFILVFLILNFLFAIIKMMLNGFEEQFPIDSIVISFTNGFFISFFVTPTIFAVLNLLNKAGGKLK